MFWQRWSGEHSPTTLLHHPPSPVERSAQKVSLDNADDVGLNLSRHLSKVTDSLRVKQCHIEV